MIVLEPFLTLFSLCVFFFFPRLPVSLPRGTWNLDGPSFGKMLPLVAGMRLKW